MKLLMFTKMLKRVGNLTVDEAADCIRDIGFDGADLVVRNDGHVLPEEVGTRLPEAIEAFERRGLIVPMITTNITDPDGAYSEQTFEAASRAGVKFLKLGYWVYEGFGNIKKQIQEARAQLKGIERLSREYGVTAGIHTHSGQFVSANPAIVLMLLQDHDPTNICAYIDLGHMLAQSGPAGWGMAVDLLSEYIRLVAIKNFWWFRKIDEKSGRRSWESKMMPLREELVPWPQAFRLLKTIGFDGNVSLHSEYEDLNLRELIHQTKDDLDYLRGVLMMAGS